MLVILLIAFIPNCLATWPFCSGEVSMENGVAYDIVLPYDPQRNRDRCEASNFLVQRSMSVEIACVTEVAVEAQTRQCRGNSLAISMNGSPLSACPYVRSQSLVYTFPVVPYKYTLNLDVALNRPEGVEMLCTIVGDGGNPKGECNACECGTNDNDEDDPWFVIISTDSAICGGTLISDCHVITMATCDGHDLSDVTITVNSTLYGASDITLHETYDDDPVIDIALITLDTCVDVMPICLSRNNVADINTEVETFAFYQEGNTTGDETLQKFNTSLVSNDECDDAFGNSSQYYDSTICAKDTEFDFCRYMHGVPMSVKVDEQVVLVGILDEFTDCWFATTEGIRAINITMYVDWLESNGIELCL